MLVLLFLLLTIYRKNLFSCFKNILSLKFASYTYKGVYVFLPSKLQSDIQCPKANTTPNEQNKKTEENNNTSDKKGKTNCQNLTN